MRDLVPRGENSLVPSPVQWREPRWRLKKGYRIVLLGFALQVLGILALPLNPYMVLPIILIGCSAFLWGRELLERETLVVSSQDLELWRSTPSAHLALVKVVNDGRELGYDRGVLTFEDNAMVFRGSRCSFITGSQDVNHEFSRQLPQPRNGTGWRIQLKGHAGAVSIGICALYLPEDVRWLLLRPTKTSLDRFRAFDEAVSAFLGNTEPTELERSYPPAVRAKSYLP